MRAIHSDVSILERHGKPLNGEKWSVQ